MISVQELMDVVAQSFFQGNTQIAGIILYLVVAGGVSLVFAARNVSLTMVFLLPITLVFSLLGVLPEVLTILVVLILIIGIAMRFRETMD